MQKLRGTGLAAATAVLLLAAIGSADATTLSTSMPVSMTVASACTQFSAGALAFGISPAGSTAPLSASTTLSVNCTMGTAYSITVQSNGSANGSIGAGSTYPGGYYCLTLAGTTDTVSAGIMSDGGSTPKNVTFGLYVDSGRTQHLAETPGCNNNDVSLTGTGTGAASSIPLYGTAQPSTAPGNYAATVTLLLSF